MMFCRERNALFLMGPTHLSMGTHAVSCVTKPWSATPSPPAVWLCCSKWGHGEHAGSQCPGSPNNSEVIFPEHFLCSTFMVVTVLISFNLHTDLWRRDSCSCCFTDGETEAGSGSLRKGQKAEGHLTPASMQIATHAAGWPIPPPPPALQKAHSCLEFPKSSHPQLKEDSRDEGLPSLLVPSGLHFLGGGRGDTGKGLSASTVQFMEGQPCHSPSAAFDPGACILHGKISLHSKNDLYTYPATTKS